MYIDLPIFSDWKFAFSIAILNYHVGLSNAKSPSLTLVSVSWHDLWHDLWNMYIIIYL